MMQRVGFEHEFESNSFKEFSEKFQPIKNELFNKNYLILRTLSTGKLLANAATERTTDSNIPGSALNLRSAIVYNTNRPLSKTVE